MLQTHAATELRLPSRREVCICRIPSASKGKSPQGGSLNVFHNQREKALHLQVRGDDVLGAWTCLTLPTAHDLKGEPVGLYV